MIIRALLHRGALGFSALALASSALAAGNCTHGRVLYNAPVGGVVSCATASCHGADPSRNLNKVKNGANDPRAIGTAINTGVGGMSIYAGKFVPTDLEDLATWIASAPNCPAAAAISFSPSFYTFTVQNIGTSSAPVTITVSNAGVLPATDLSFDNSNAAEFPMTTNCGATLSSNASCEITASFRPAASGRRNATLTANSSGGAATIALAGSGKDPNAPGPQVWNGPRIAFSKPAFVGPVNQDRITPNVWLARDDFYGLFNAAKEDGYDILSVDSPLGTEWAYGTTANYASLDYGVWFYWHGENPPSSVGKDAVLHLIDDDIYIDIKFTSWDTRLNGGAYSYERATPTAGGATASAIEYYHAAFNHYFITRNADEIAKLDNGTFAGWARTGLAFKVYTSAIAGASSVCRFFSTAFDPKSSHFYTPFAAECAALKNDRNWQFEGEGSDVFFIPVAAADGTCQSGTSPVYRLYNNGDGGAPNHRYTSASSVRDQMLTAGWILEGNGPGFAFMCAP